MSLDCLWEAGTGVSVAARGQGRAHTRMCTCLATGLVFPRRHMVPGFGGAPWISGCSDSCQKGRRAHSLSA